MTRTPTEASLAEIAHLIGMDTTSRDSNLVLIDDVAERLRSRGIEPTIIPNPEGTKANLLATFPAADGGVHGGIVLSGHTDVVPVDGQDWSSDPFAVEIGDGRLYGRGSADMKSFVAVILTKLDDILARPLAEPIHLALSYDEEVGCLGAVSLVEEIVSQGLSPKGCIVGEPTSMRIVRGHKSVCVMTVDFHGVAAHSSLTPHGVNAISHAAEFVRYVHQVAAEFAEQGPFDDDFIVPYTTTTANMISGGIAVNTIPALCSVSFEFRALVSVGLDELIERYRAEASRIEAVMRADNPVARVDFAVLASAPGLDTAMDADIMTIAAGFGGTPSSAKVTYGTEAGLFANAGIPTVVCGPGDIAQAHGPDEFIDLDQIALCEDFVDRVIASARA